MHGEGKPGDITNSLEGIKKPVDKNKMPEQRPQSSPYVEDEYDALERLKRFEELLDNQARDRDKKE